MMPTSLSSASSYIAHLGPDHQQCSQHANVTAHREACERPACTIFYDLAARQNPPPDRNASERLHQIITATTADHLNDVKRLASDMEVSGQRIPYQQLAIAAAERSHAEILAYCLDAGAVVDDQIQFAAWKGASPELYAVMMAHNWPSCIGLSISQVLDTNYIKGPRMIDFLIQRGAKVSSQVIRSITRTSQRDTASLEMLMENGVDLKGSGALQLAASQNNVTVVKFLLDRGIYVDEVPEEDTWDPRECINGTPLCRALQLKHVEAAKVLLKRGADPEMRDQMGRSARDIAKQAGIEEVFGGD